ncbi:MAG: putative baseplate assembly protein [Litorilinea sp.]
MSLPVPNLDDLRFQQDLVDEARLRIIRYCPEWTEYNVSDPGITLIELFAWMTEMMVYRLNKVPEKNYIQFLNMVGVDLQPASSAETELTFRLSAPFPLRAGETTTAVVPAELEVATYPTPDAPEVIFTTVEPLYIVSPQLAQLRGADFHRNYLPRLGIELFTPFTEPRPQVGDTFYLGFDADYTIAGHIVRLTIECERTEAVGIRREDPPLVWECSMGDGLWEEIRPSILEGERDTTGGLNNESGQITFYLPKHMRPDPVFGREAFWIRCRYEPRRREQGRYSQSPRIRQIHAFALGATTRAMHAVFTYFEELGVSTGDPGQNFRLSQSPVLDLAEDETLEVEEIRDGLEVFVPWQRVKDFSKSSRFDRHFVLDTASGQIRFGPAIRQPDGAVRQYGRVPESGRTIRMTKYRHGGGVGGNVPTAQIQVLRSAVPYIDRVTNMTRAAGGRDQETLEEAIERGRREMRAQYRAVTGEDFENLALGMGREIGRVQCLAPGQAESLLPPGMIELLVVPAVFDSLQVGDLSNLQLGDELNARLLKHMDQYRLLTTTLRIREPEYVGVQVRAQIVVSEYARPDVVTKRVEEALLAFLSPLRLPGNAIPTGIVDEDWVGWPFGRDLYIAEIFSLIQQVSGVKHVLDVQMSQRPVVPNSEAPPLGQLEEYPAPVLRNGQAQGGLTPVTGRVLLVPADGILCSLPHQVEIVEL